MAQKNSLYYYRESFFIAKINGIRFENLDYTIIESIKEIKYVRN